MTSSQTETDGQCISLRLLPDSGVNCIGSGYIFISLYTRSVWQQTYDGRSSLDQGRRRISESFVVFARPFRSKVGGQEKMIVVAGIYAMFYEEMYGRIRGHGWP